MLDRRMLRNLDGARAALAGAVAAGMAGAALAVVQAWLLSRVIGGIFLRHLPAEAAVPWLAALALAAAARAGAGIAGQAAASRAAERVKVRLRARLHRRLFDLGPAAVAGERSGELTATLAQGVEALESYLAQYLPHVFLAALVPAALWAAVVARDGVSALILACTAPAIPLFMVLIGAKAAERTRRQWTVLGRMSAHFLDVLQGLTMLRILGRSRDEAGRIAAVSGEFRSATMGVLRIAFLSSFALELLATLGTALIAVTIGLRLLKGGLAFEPALMVLLLAPEFYQPLRTLGARFHAGMEGLSSARRIFELLDTGEGGRVAEGRRPDDPALRVTGMSRATGARPADAADSMGGSPFLPGPVEIAFEDVRFAYGPGGPEALRGVTFRLAPGAVTALVGPSGSGKSTVARMLLRFLEPAHGRIEVRWERRTAGEGERPTSNAQHPTPNGERRTPNIEHRTSNIEHRTSNIERGGAEHVFHHSITPPLHPSSPLASLSGWFPLRDIPAADWRRLVSWVPQRPHLFHGTIADNIRLACPSAPTESVREAASNAGLLGFVESLPRQWDTEIGERGLRLSGGQAQRLALARAFLKDAQVVILDEPTSFLDAESEEQLRRAIERLSAGRTTLVIAHRLPTVRRAARVVVLQAGTVVEQGAPSELSAAGGAFAAMWRAYRGDAP